MSILELTSQRIPSQEMQLDSDYSLSVMLLHKVSNLFSEGQCNENCTSYDEELCLSHSQFPLQHPPEWSDSPNAERFTFPLGLAEPKKQKT
jgi:hypothetical protein